MTAPIAPIGATAPGLSGLSGLSAAVPEVRAGAPSFSQMLIDGIESANRRVTEADSLVRAFAVDQSIPLHQVTFALEEARLSMELMMQVRARLVESYQRMMEMQI